MSLEKRPRPSPPSFEWATCNSGRNRGALDEEAAREKGGKKVEGRRVEEREDSEPGSLVAFLRIEPVTERLWREGEMD